MPIKPRAMAARLRGGPSTSAIIALIMVGLCALSAALLEAARRDAWSAALTAARNLVTSEAADIGRSLTIYDASLATVVSASADPAVAAAPPLLRQRALFNQIGQTSFLGPVRIVDRSGRVLADSSMLAPPPATALERQAVLRQAGNPGGGLLFGSPVTEAPDRSLVTMSRRIDGPDGRYVGAVVGTIRLDSIVAGFRQLRLSPHDVVSLFLENGTVLAHAPGDPMIGRSIAGTRVMQVFTDHRSGTFVLRSALDGTVRVYTLAHIDQLPLMLDVGLCVRDLYGAWRHRALLLGSLIAAMAGLTLFLLGRVQRELDRRLAAEAATRSSERRYRLIADNASDVIIHLDAALVRTYVSPSSRQLGYEPDELLGRTPRDWVHPDDLEHAVDTLLAQDRSSHLILTYRILRKDGRPLWVETHWNRLADGGFVAILRDVDDRRRKEIELQELRETLGRLATTDGLTDLQNRRSFDQRLSESWQLAHRDASPLAILFIDIDQFKLFNDAHGHQAGDAVLKRVAERIAVCLRRTGDVAARYGGEEFAVILPRADLYGAIEVAENIRRAVIDAGLRHEAASHGVVTVSIGAASTLPRLSRSTPEMLLALADEALYAAKARGRNDVVAKLLPAGRASALMQRDDRPDA